jgi:hypothetical protein
MNALLPLPIDAATRVRIEEHIEMLLSILDAADGDPHLEPYLAGASWEGNGDDREDESELLEDGADSEPNGDEIDTSFCDDEYTSRIC